MSHFGIVCLVSLQLVDGVTGDAAMGGCRERTGTAGFDASTLRLMQQALSEDLEGDEWIDQRRSPLIAHCATVIARIEAGLGGAAIDGQRYLLSTAALAEEMSNGAT
jgi:hypothetical protein